MSILDTNFKDPKTTYAETLPLVYNKVAETNQFKTINIEKVLTSGDFNKQIDDKRNLWLENDKYLKDGANGDGLQKWMHSQITTNYKSFNPHVSGFYYIHMVPGTWVKELQDYTDKLNGKAANNHNDSVFGEFSQGFKGVSTAMLSNFGQYASDIDIPQLSMDYEVISGKSRSLNYASRTQFTGDFTINFIEDYNLNVFRYHELWFKYIEALRKGYITQPIGNNNDEKMFIDIPYFNAVWVAIFKPFSIEIQGLIKIMGVSPISLPFKQILGDRAKNTITTINANYKSTDMIHKFFKGPTELIHSDLYKDFEKDIIDAKAKSKK